MKIGSISKVSAVAILGLTLAFMVPATATPKLSLQTQLLSQRVNLIPWTNTAVIPLTTTGGCLGSGPNQNTPVTIPVGGLNFTENLAGRDVGSTIVQFKPSPGIPQTFLFKSKDLTRAVTTELYCDFGTGYPVDLLNKMQIWLGGSWRTTEAGNYTLYTLEACVGCAITNPFVPTIVANETWTATVIV